MAGALGLIWSLPELSPRLTRGRGILVPGVIIIAVSFTMDRWVGSTLNLHRIPLQLVIGALVWLALEGLRKLGLPRWSMAAIVATFTFLCITAQAASRDWGIPLGLLSIIGVLSNLVVGAGLVLGRIASQSSQRDGDLAVAIFVGYAIGQWIPKFF